MAVNHWVRGSNPRGGVFLFIRQFTFEGGDANMRVCECCGKGTVSGNSVSKSMNHQRRVWKPNLVKVKLKMGNGGVRTFRLCTRCLRTGDRYAFLEKKI